MIIKKFLLKKIKWIYRNIYRPYVPEVWQWKFLSFISGRRIRGKNSYISPTVQMTGASNISIGFNSSVGEFTWLNVNNKIIGDIAISIGDNCFIGRRNFFSSGKNITISDYALTAIDCKFLCANHMVENPMLPYIASGVTFSDSIYVGVNCHFGAGAVVLGNVVIGHGSIVGTNSLVTKNVPPFSIVVGNPAKVIRRYSFLKQVWIDASEIMESDLVNNLTEVEYLNALKKSHPKIYMPLSAAGHNFGDV